MAPFWRRPVELLELRLTEARNALQTRRMAEHNAIGNMKHWWSIGEAVLRTSNALVA